MLETFWLSSVHLMGERGPTGGDAELNLYIQEVATFPHLETLHPHPLVVSAHPMVLCQPCFPLLVMLMRRMGEINQSNLRTLRVRQKESHSPLSNQTIRLNCCQMVNIMQGRCPSQFPFPFIQTPSWTRRQTLLMASHKLIKTTFQMCTAKTFMKHTPLGSRCTEERCQLLPTSYWETQPSSDLRPPPWPTEGSTLMGPCSLPEPYQRLLRPTKTRRSLPHRCPPGSL